MNRNCPRVGTFTMPFALCCWSRTGDERIALTERRNGSDKNSADRHGIASGHEVGYDVEGDHDRGTPRGTRPNGKGSYPKNLLKICPAYVVYLKHHPEAAMDTKLEGRKWKIPLEFHHPRLCTVGADSRPLGLICRMALSDVGIRFMMSFFGMFAL